MWDYFCEWLLQWLKEWDCFQHFHHRLKVFQPFLMMRRHHFLGRIPSYEYSVFWLENMFEQMWMLGRLPKFVNYQNALKMILK